MSASAQQIDARSEWREANRQYVMTRVAEVRIRLLRWIESRGGAVSLGVPSTEQAAAAAEAAGAAVPGPSSLERLARAFSLSPFEESILAACAAVELDTTVGGLCAQALNDADRKLFTVALAISVLPEAHWTAITPAAPLRHWHLVELTTGPSLTACGLRVDERVLHFMMGSSQMDPRLEPLVTPLPDAALLRSQSEVVDGTVQAWQSATRNIIVPMQVHGADVRCRLAVAAAIARRVGLTPYRLPAQVLPAAPQELETFVRLWERESVLDHACPVLDCSGDLDPARLASVRSMIEALQAPLIVVTPQPVSGTLRPELLVEAPAPQASEQLDCWRETLGPEAEALAPTLARISGQFHLSPADIDAIWKEARAATLDRPLANAAGVLWGAARRRSRGSLEEMAQRLQASPDWNDLVLPDPQKDILRQVATQVSHRARVYHDWGFDAGGTRGLGLGVLFSGPPGTGKTLAAEVLAAHLKLDLYRIDLSAVVSKYIGDTERNLRRLFDAAEICGAILLFDEADALFGERSEVKDSHDRYANIEVSYLLQRVEAYRGLAILTTNRKRALDQAFQRRLRFAVEFPFPDAQQRAEIWRRAFPPNTPREALDYTVLARLDLAGGGIRNIAMNAAFLAADDDKPVSMRHLLAAARAEYSKMERSLNQAEFGSCT
jgi:ATPase family associated with various cellular activities (AAA)